MKYPALLLILAYSCTASNILVLFPYSSFSHYNFLRPIGLELARRGHNVTIITSNVEKDPPANYRQVVADKIKIWDASGTGRPNVFEMAKSTYAQFFQTVFWSGGLFTTENILKSESVKNFMREDNQFDLVISELFFQEALYMFAHKYSAPLILVPTYGNSMKLNFMKRNPMQMSTLVHEHGTIKNPGSFYGRLKNLYYFLYDYHGFYTWYLPRQEEIARKYFTDLKEPVPPLYELGSNSALVLMNTHFSIDTPAAYNPGFVQIAGLHLTKSSAKLPSDLQKFIDEAEQGVVYVNFGSNLRSSELPPQKRDTLIKVFSKLKQRVLFKWEETDVPFKQDNVEVRAWLPQKEILSHPNVKLFISHGGLIGFQEAVFNGVPIVGVPVYADQYNNLLQGKELGFAEILEYDDIEESNLEDAINEMLKPEYKENAVKVSQRFLDRPMSPVNESMYWIEYVIRHKGAGFMRSPALDMNIFEYLMLDVYLFLLIVLVVTAILIKKVFLQIHAAIVVKKKLKTK